MNGNQPEVANAGRRSDALNEDSGVSAGSSHEARPSIDREVADEIRPLVVAEMKRYAEKLRRIRQHYEGKLKKFEDMQVEWIAMRDQEEIALRLSRDQEREINELQQEVASAKEEVHKARRLVNELTQKAEKSEAAKMNLMKRTTARDEALSLIASKIQSLRMMVLGKQQHEMNEKRCDSGDRNSVDNETEDQISEEECLQKAHQLASDLDAIHKEVQNAMSRLSRIAQVDECRLRNQLENELTHLKEKCAHWQRESELLRRKQTEFKEKLDEMLPVTEKMLGSVNEFANFLRQPDCNDTNTPESSCVAISELCDKIKARVNASSDSGLSRIREMPTSGISDSAATARQQHIETVKAVGSSKNTGPSDHKHERRGHDPIRSSRQTSDLTSREMKLIFGGVVRTKIVEQVCTSTSVASTSKSDHCDVRRILVLDSSPSRARRLLTPKRRGTDNLPDSKPKRTKTMQRCLKQAPPSRKIHLAKMTSLDSSGDEVESMGNNA